MTKPVTSPWVIRKGSKIHGYGLFAARDIPEGTFIIEYVGEKITKKESDLRGPQLVEEAKGDSTLGSVYIFTLNGRYDIDGNVSYNWARFANHSCNPNCESDIVRGRIYIISIKDIKKGEEITYNYGYDIDCYDEHPCRCGSDNCVGYIVVEEKWPSLKTRLARKKKRLTKSASANKK